MRTAVAVAVAALALLLAAPATARTLDVRPGEDALSKAIERAEPGDTLRLHPGRYPESVAIDEPLRIVGAPGEPRPVIDARCRDRSTIAIHSAGVALRRLTVIGADEGFGPFPSAVDFASVRSGSAAGLRLRDTCDAEYGINVFDTGAVVLRKNRARGFSDAGFYIGSISDTGSRTLTVTDNEAWRNNRGVIVEDSAGVSIHVRANDLHDNRAPGEGIPSGIFVRNSDAIRFSDNEISANGEYGIHLDPDSDANVLTGNRVRGNPVDLLDEGSENCGSGNRFGGAGNLLPPC